MRGLNGIPIEINGTTDHVHLLVRLRPVLSVSEFLSKLKSNSSSWAKRQIAGRFGWQARFGAFTVSESEVERMRRYIRNQEEHHRAASFEDEFKALLRALIILILMKLICGHECLSPASQAANFKIA